MANIPKNIKECRTACKMTQEQLAEKMFVTRQTVSNYENGKSKPDIETLMRLADIFGVETERLLYGPADRETERRKGIRLAVSGGIVILLTIILIVVRGYAIRLQLEWMAPLPGDLFLAFRGAAVLGGTILLAAAALPYLRPAKLSSRGEKLLRILKWAVGIYAAVLFLNLIPYIGTEMYIMHQIFEAQRASRGIEISMEIPFLLGDQLGYLLYQRMSLAWILFVPDGILLAWPSGRKKQV